MWQVSFWDSIRSHVLHVLCWLIRSHDQSLLLPSLIHHTVQQCFNKQIETMYQVSVIVSEIFGRTDISKDISSHSTMTIPSLQWKIREIRSSSWSWWKSDNLFRAQNSAICDVFMGRHNVMTSFDLRGLLPRRLAVSFTHSRFPGINRLLLSNWVNITNLTKQEVHLNASNWWLLETRPAQQALWERSWVQSPLKFI